MTRNLLDGLRDLAEGKFSWKISKAKKARVRGSVQSKGESLEEIFKDILCGVTRSKTGSRPVLYERHLAYQGGKRNPPDAILRGGEDGDAFEVKKVLNNQKLQLNSSHPHSSIERGKSRLTVKANRIEPETEWNKRDLFYVVGDIEIGKAKGNWLWVVEGQVIAQETSYYEQLEKRIRESISESLGASGLAFSVSNELGRVDDVDHLKRTDLRIRGMWLLSNPKALFADDLQANVSLAAHCTVITLLTKSKWDRLLSLSSQDLRTFWDLPPTNVVIRGCRVREPDDSNQDLQCMLVIISIPV